MDVRTIVHLDLDAFFCAVEELRNPALHSKPFAVGAPPESRGVVASCSYAARRFGVKSAMPMARALRLCPGMIIVSPHYSHYQEISRQVMAYLHSVSPILEQVSIDEAFLDVTQLLLTESSSIEQLARQIQGHIHQNYHLPVSLGIASNKLVAKIANDVGKSASRGDEPPNAITMVPSGQEAEFLAPLPVQMLWGVGPKTARRLAGMGISTIGDLARHPVIELVRVFGVTGMDMSRHASGIDPSLLNTSHEVKSISQETTFSRDLQDPQVLIQTIGQLSEEVSRRLIDLHLAGTTVKIKIRYPDFTTITRQKSFEIPISESSQISKIAAELFFRHWESSRTVRLLGVGVSHLVKVDWQLSLWNFQPYASPNLETPDRRQQLQTVIDEIQAKYGYHVLQRGFRDRSEKRNK